MENETNEIKEKTVKEEMYLLVDGLRFSKDE